MARPIKELNPDIESIIEKLATIHCTDAEIASRVGLSERTLRRRYGRLLKKGREEGKTSLRAMQMLAAQKGNVTMQIWLGKQLLHQRDQPIIAIDNKVDITLDTEWGRPDEPKGNT